MTERVRVGAAYALASAALFAATGACIKAAAPTVATPVIVFARNAIALLVLLPWAWRVGRAGLITRRPGAHLWRAGLGLTAMYCFFYALGRLPLAEAMLLNYSSPVFIPVIAWLWIGERPGRWAVPASLIGFAGVAMIVKPGQDAWSEPAALIGALSGLFAAGAFVGIRRMAATESSTLIVFYFSFISSLVSAGPAIALGAPPGQHEVLLLIGTGVSAVFGQIMLTRAYTCASAASIAPFSYANVVFGGLVGWLWWSEAPDAWSLAGAAIIVLTCIGLSLARDGSRH